MEKIDREMAEYMADLCTKKKRKWKILAQQITILNRIGMEEMDKNEEEKF